MARETFRYPETRDLFKLLEQTARRSAVSRAQAFEDFLLMSTCALSGGQMEDQYMETVAKHTEGKKGKRGCDSLAQMFGEMVNMMEETRGEMKDVLGDLFEGAITYGEAGQFLTPEPITRMLAKMATADVPQEPGHIPTVSDPCCGSGRMLLAVAEENPHWHFHGQDVDLRCVRMTAINLGLRNLYGYVVHGNSITLEKKLVYRTGFNLRGVIREVPLEECPTPVQQSEVISPQKERTKSKDSDQLDDPPTNQLTLF